MVIRFNVSSLTFAYCCYDNFQVTEDLELIPLSFESKLKELSRDISFAKFGVELRELWLFQVELCADCWNLRGWRFKSCAILEYQLQYSSIGLKMTKLSRKLEFGEEFHHNTRVLAPILEY